MTDEQISMVKALPPEAQFLVRRQPNGSEVVQVIQFGRETYWILPSGATTTNAPVVSASVSAADNI